jgi:hypothetical protein
MALAGVPASSFAAPVGWTLCGGADAVKLLCWSSASRIPLG